MSATQDPEIEIFNRVIKDHGYTNENFEISIQEVTGYVIVTSNVSGISRTYKSRYGIGWVFEFETDMQVKEFS